MKLPRRRKSLDETLSNPFKTLLAPRFRRQSLNGEQVVEQFQNNNVKTIENDIYAMLPFQTATKKRLQEALSNPIAPRDFQATHQNNSSLKQFSRQAARRSFNENMSAVRLRRSGISNLPFQRDSKPNYNFHCSRDEYNRAMNENHVRDAFLGIHQPITDMNESFDSLSVKDIEIRSKTKNVESTELIQEGMNQKSVRNDKNSNTLTHKFPRSVSAGNVLEKAIASGENKFPLCRSFSEQRECRGTDNKSSITCRHSPLLKKASQDRYSGSYSFNKGEEKGLPLKTPNLKKKLFKPLVNRIRKDTITNNRILDNERLRLLMNSILEKRMKHLKYDPTLSIPRCRLLSKTLEDTLKEKLASTYKEYKIVALVFIGETRDQGIAFATQCTYNDDDLYAISTIEKDNMYIWAVVFAILLQNDVLHVE